MNLAQLFATDCLNAGKDTRMFAENLEREIRRGDVAAAEVAMHQIAEAAHRAQMYAADALRNMKQVSAEYAEISALRCLLADEGYGVGPFTGAGNPPFSRPENKSLRDHMWRIAQGLAEPQAYAKSVLKEMGYDYDAEQVRVNARVQP